MNAMEHGNGYRDDQDVRLVVSLGDDALVVRIVDRGGDREIAQTATPDIDAKLEGRQSPRGWGLFLIEKMVDEVRQSSNGAHHTVELVMHLEGARDDARES
jgi:anti-sigma regulatory factor (Ser/Thr protein kinase)